MGNSFDILVKGDFRQVTKGFIDLSKKLEDISKKQFGFKMDPDTKKFFMGGGEVLMKKLKNSLKEANLGMQDMAKTAGRSAFDFKNFEEAADRVSRLQTELNSVERTLNRTSSGKGGRLLMNLMGGGLRKMGVGEGAIGAMESAGSVVGAGGSAVLGAMLGYGYGGYKIAKGGYNTWAASNDTKLGLMGAGLSRGDINGIVRGGRRGMYTADESLKQGSALLGTSGSIANLGSMQTMSRAYGVDMGQLIGVSGGLRQGGNSNAAIGRQMATMIGDSVASGLERSRIGEYLSMISGYTGQIADEQFGGVGSGDVSRTISSIMAGNSGYFSQPGGAIQAAGMMSGAIQSAVGGGMNLGFVQQQMSSMYPGAGPEKIAMMMRRGLFQQIDPEQMAGYVNKGLLSKDEAGTFQGASSIDIARKMVGASLNQSKQAGLNPIQTGRKLSLDVFGGKVGELQSLTFGRGLMSSDSKISGATMEEVNKSMQTDMEAIRSSTEGTEKNTKVLANLFSYSTGDSISGAIVGGKKLFENFKQSIYGGGGTGGDGGSNFITKTLGTLFGPVFSSNSPVGNLISGAAGSSNFSGLKFKSSAIGNSMGGVNPKMAKFASELNSRMMQEFGFSPMITDTFLYDKHAAGSKHYKGSALDYSANGMTPAMISLANTVAKENDVSFQHHGKGSAPHYHAELVEAVKDLSTTMKSKTKDERKKGSSVPRYTGVSGSW